MWSQKGRARKKGETTGIVAVAIDKDKGSQHALKWAADNLVSKGQTIVLIHVVNKTTDAEGKERIEKQTIDLFMTFHCYCTRKDIRCLDVTLEDKEIVKALTEYAACVAIENLVLGAPSRNGFIRKFKISDVPSNVSKAAPDFCTVYVISKGKISSLRSASRTAPFSSPLLSQIENQSAVASYEKFRNTMSFKDRTSFKPSPSSSAIEDSFRSPFAKAKNNGNSFYDFSDSETEISFVSSGRPSTSTTTSSPSFIYEFPEYSGLTPRLSTSSAQSIGSTRSGIKPSDSSLQQDFSFVSQDSGRTSCSCSSQGLEEAEEMRRLKRELKHTMDLYGTACREALAAKQEAQELQRRKAEEEQRSQQGQHSAAQRRVRAECNGLGKCEKVTASRSDTSLSYRRYTIEEIEVATNHFSESNKIGEGGYGPVFKCHLDHTAVAVKALRPDAEQGRSQFQKEVEVLSCIRHPNMVLLLGACPEYGVLVYEYMARGSLADRLRRRGNTAPLSWPLRFRIAAEIATALLFLHQTKPEPLVHRDLKPGNILLDQNYVSKISDVGLARLVPAVAENVTQCHVTSTAGTFCYIDPEYQQTGMLGVKSDVYSFGILLLELLTNREPMGLAYYVEQAIEEGTFKDMLDPSVQDWPVEEALSLAKLALKCTELRRKDRPDLGKVVLPQLNRLRALAEENMEKVMFSYTVGVSPNPSQVTLPIVDVVSMNSECSKTQSSSSSDTEKHSPGA